MTAWGEFTEADFDMARAPRYVRDNQAAGMVPLFGAGTPTVKRAAGAELDGQEAMFPDDLTQTSS